MRIQFVLHFMQDRWKMAIQLRLKELRLAADMSPADVARALGRPQSTVSRRETGEVTLYVADLEEYARLFSCHPAELIAGPHILTDLEKAILEEIRRRPASGQRDILTALSANAAA